ncbi:unnamed protein product [Macrosiphum euphorbiae]|uniref:DDE Tnp4 domain-containing protein n=1 Tax=Macrosiphum euphorbiae TaxID=13131 RepID=A0AAV0WBT4_9HEMI|nr:unnamed protein product [Macrosiphum euphorbiae]
MTQDTYGNLLTALSVNSELIKPYTGGNKPVSFHKKVLISLWYYGREMSMHAIGNQFDTATSTIYNIVQEVTDCLCNSMAKKCITWPNIKECTIIEEGFRVRANFPNVIGAIDGCHISVKVPSSEQDSYTNRKMTKSIIVQAICTSNKIFTNICVGYPGRVHDARVFKNSEIFSIMQNEGPSSLFYDKYYLLGDSAYPNLSWLITPYKNYGNLSARKRKWNYFHSQTRVDIELSFGLLKGRWRRLLYLNVTNISRAPNIILACCVLHNFCLVNDDELDEIVNDVQLDYTSQTDIQNAIYGTESGNAKRDKLLNILVP